MLWQQIAAPKAKHSLDLWFPNVLIRGMLLLLFVECASQMSERERERESTKKKVPPPGVQQLKLLNDVFEIFFSQIFRISSFPRFHNIVFTLSTQQFYTILKTSSSFEVRSNPTVVWRDQIGNCLGLKMHYFRNFYGFLKERLLCCVFS